MGRIGGAERGCGRRNLAESSEGCGAQGHKELCLSSRAAAHITCAVMKFRYDTRYTEHGFEMAPRVPVVFQNPLNKREIPIFCLVDSGASEILIAIEVALALGIDIERGEPRIYGGIGGEIKGYVHAITMRLMNDRHEFAVECGVLPLPAYDGLLGQRGFFDHYKVTFEKYKETFEITAKK